MSDKTVELHDCNIIRESAKAFLIEWEGTELWVPKSQIMNESELYLNATGVTVIIPQWLADDKELDVND